MKNDDVSDNPERLMGVIASASDSQELDMQYILELLRPAIRGGRMYTDNSETSGMPSAMLLVHLAIDLQVNHECPCQKRGTWYLKTLLL